MPAFVSNIWKPFGLRRDPFFQEELRPDPDAEYPVQRLFVGRDEALVRIGRHVGGSDPSRTIIEGGPGVGKTSFVNRIKASFAEEGFLVHDQPIRVSSRTDADSFCADILRVLTRIHAAKGGPRDEFWKNAAFLVEGATVMSGGLSIGPAGFSLQRDRHGPEMGRVPLIEMVGEGLHRLRKDAGVPMILHVNNLENLGREDLRSAANLMQDVRDVFTFPGAHWLMAGTTGIEQAIFRVVPQVSGFFPIAVKLAALTPVEVRALLERRYVHLAEPGASLVPPVEPATASGLYERYRGDLRNFLRLLSEAATLLLGVEEIRPLREAEILRTMGTAYRRQAIELLGDQAFAHLTVLARMGAGEARGFRVAEARQWLGLSQAGASGVVAKLAEAGMIAPVARERKSVYYQLSGMASVATAPGA